MAGSVNVAAAARTHARRFFDWVLCKATSRGPLRRHRDPNDPHIQIHDPTPRFHRPMDPYDPHPLDDLGGSRSRRPFTPGLTLGGSLKLPKMDHAKAAAEGDETEDIRESVPRRNHGRSLRKQYAAG